MDREYCAGLHVEVTHLGLCCPRHRHSDLLLPLELLFLWSKLLLHRLLLCLLLLLLWLVLLLLDCFQEVRFHLPAQRQCKLLDVIAKLIP